MKIFRVELGEQIVGGPQQVIHFVERLIARSVQSEVACQPGVPLVIKSLVGSGK